MSGIVGHPALALLARRKLRGTLRKTGRRLRTWKGATFTVLGVVLIGIWMGSLLLPILRGSWVPPEPARQLPKIELVALLLVVLNLASALQHRGLFLPRDEIERLFSAPVSAADLIRYRMLATAGRSTFGAFIIGVMAMRRMPIPLLAFAGIFLGVMTVPILHQCLAILAGGFERRFAARLRRLARIVSFVVVTIGLSLVLYLVLGERVEDSAPVEWIRSRFGPAAADPLALPAVRAVLSPFWPWAKMIAAPTGLEFLGWFLVCGGIWILLFELTARIPLDYRELSLETSAHVAARLRRVARGGGAAAGEASQRLAGWRIPWLFGRGAGGAVAWRKTGAILRKARGTLWTSVLILAFLTIASTAIVRGNDGPMPALAPPLLLSVLGTLYLCSGLRFDFRDELDRMDVIKTWPVPAARLFLAMLLPEVALVSVILVGAIGLRVLVAGSGPEPAVVILLLLQPLFVMAWVGLDNAVFLLVPVRFTPGQDGALQNAGRGMLMMLLRLLMLAVIGGVGGGVAVGTWHLLAGPLGASEDAAYAVAGAALWGAVLLVDAAVVHLGGKALQRFDVARDRG
ncbi:MAG: putative ABC exporter domain-containing protein [Planctomycetota bacterium]